MLLVEVIALRKTVASSVANAIAREEDSGAVSRILRAVTSCAAVYIFVAVFKRRTARCLDRKSEKK